jgi:hypothetical protein
MALGEESHRGSIMGFSPRQRRKLELGGYDLLEQRLDKPRD